MLYRRHGKTHCNLGWRLSRTTIFSRYQPRPGDDSPWPTSTRLMLPRPTASSKNTSDYIQHTLTVSSTGVLPSSPRSILTISFNPSPFTTTNNSYPVRKCPVYFLLARLPSMLTSFFATTQCYILYFHQNWQRRKNPQKKERVRWGQYRTTPSPILSSKTAIVGQKVLKIHANIK